MTELSQIYFLAHLCLALLESSLILDDPSVPTRIQLKKLSGRICEMNAKKQDWSSIMSCMRFDMELNQI